VVVGVVYDPIAHCLVVRSKPMKGHDMRITLHWAAFIAAVAVVATILLCPVFAQQSYTVVPVRPIPTVPVAPYPTEHKILPPEQFDHYYDGDLTIVMVKTIEELLILCNVTNPNTLACSIRAYDGKSCVIVMVEDEMMRRRAWTTGLLLLHEMGHCNGWTQAHEGQRSVYSDGSYWVPETRRIKLPADRWQRQLTKQWEYLCAAAPKGPRLGSR
jgi:hypothetical protein